MCGMWRMCVSEWVCLYTAHTKKRKNERKTDINAEEFFFTHNFRWKKESARVLACVWERVRVYTKRMFFRRATNERTDGRMVGQSEQVSRTHTSLTNERAQKYKVRACVCVCIYWSAYWSQTRNNACVRTKSTELFQKPIHIIQCTMYMLSAHLLFKKSILFLAVCCRWNELLLLLLDYTNAVERTTIFVCSSR